MRESANLLISDLMTDGTLCEPASTDYPVEKEKCLSGIFCSLTENFATVSTTVLLMHQSGQCYLEEVSYKHYSSTKYERCGQVCIDFNLPQADDFKL
jgi:uncharacterized protein with NRDE domain